MNRNKIENVYRQSGLTDYLLKNVDDLLKCHKVDVRSIPGYDTLDNLNQSLYKTFIVNFLITRGLKAYRPEPMFSRSPGTKSGSGCFALEYHLDLSGGDKFFSLIENLSLPICLRRGKRTMRELSTSLDAILNRYLPFFFGQSNGLLLPSKAGELFIACTRSLICYRGYG